MSIPYFTRQAGPNDYGGGPNKRDYGVPGPVNPQTDVTAGQLRRLAADAASIAKLAPIASLAILTRESGTPADPTVTFCQMPFGSAGPYEGDDPPLGFPTVERVGQHHFRVTLPALVADAAGNEAEPVIRFPSVTAAANPAAPNEANSGRVRSFAGREAEFQLFVVSAPTDTACFVEIA